MADPAASAADATAMEADYAGLYDDLPLPGADADALPQLATYDEVSRPLFPRSGVWARGLADWVVACFVQGGASQLAHRVATLEQENAQLRDKLAKQGAMVRTLQWAPWGHRARLMPLAALLHLWRLPWARS